MKGISGTPGSRLALINNQTLAPGESAKVRLGQTNVMVSCLSIREKSVLIQVKDEAAPRELALNTCSNTD